VGQENEIQNEVSFDSKQLTTADSNLVTYNYEETPITDIVNEIILDAIKKRASDIHFDPSEKGLKIRIRVDGDLLDYSIVPLYVQKNMITRIKIIAGMNITESRVPQDGAIKNNLDNIDIDLRVSSLPTNMGEKVVIRILDYSMSSAGIEQLDFSKTNYDKVIKMINVPNGIILVTGATGSGKSTTVYSILQRLNTVDRNLITVEDPVEMNIEGINQVQVNPEIGLTFASALRSILRQDPDIIMIGEIRDDETARIAVRAAITGHLVLSTIHTNDSLNTIERLTDMEVERYLLGAALSGIISQKLARRLCKNCRTARPTTEYEKKVFKEALNIDVKEIYEPKGCSECNGGYRGRIAIHEVLLITNKIRDAITQNMPKPEVRKLVYGSGTITMLQDGLEKVVAGETTFDEILKLIDLEDDLGSNTNIGLKQNMADSQVNKLAGSEQLIQNDLNNTKIESTTVIPTTTIPPIPPIIPTTTNINNQATPVTTPIVSTPSLNITTETLNMNDTDNDDSSNSGIDTLDI
jgi:type IV pilus assembly protein PilB